MQGAQPQEEKKIKHIEITNHDEVRIKLKNFSGGFAANSLKHLIVPNCLEDRTHTEAIRNDTHGEVFTGKQH